jgi:hypothetical protein
MAGRKKCIDVDGASPQELASCALPVKHMTPLYRGSHRKDDRRKKRSGFPLKVARIMQKAAMLEHVLPGQLNIISGHAIMGEKQDVFFTWLPCAPSTDEDLRTSDIQNDIDAAANQRAN